MLRLAIVVSALLTAGVPALAEQYISLVVSGKVSNSGSAQSAGIGMGETQAVAIERAMKQCQEHNGTNCQVVENQKGGCFAIAKDPGTDRAGIGIKPTEAAALEAAIANCKEAGRYPGCAVMNSACVK